MYTVNIRDRTTGFVRPHEVEFDWDDNQKWLWTEGNFGCDCNRRIFFGDDRDDVACTEMYFDIRVVDRAGHVVYDEWN